MAAEDAIKATIDELLKALSAKNIIGEPIEMEDKIIIPITKMGMGFGTGVGQGDDARQGEVASAAGGGVGVFPVAVVIVFKNVVGSEGVKVVPLAAPSPLTEPVSSIARILVDRLVSRRESGEKKSGNTGAIRIE